MQRAACRCLPRGAGAAARRCGAIRGIRTLGPRTALRSSRGALQPLAALDGRAAPGCPKRRTPPAHVARGPVLPCSRALVLAKGFSTAGRRQKRMGFRQKLASIGAALTFAAGGANPAGRRPTSLAGPAAVRARCYVAPALMLARCAPCSGFRRHGCAGEGGRTVGHTPWQTRLVKQGHGRRGGVPPTPTPPSTNPSPHLCPLLHSSPHLCSLNHILSQTQRAARGWWRPPHSTGACRGQGVGVAVGVVGVGGITFLRRSHSLPSPVRVASIRSRGRGAGAVRAASPDPGRHHLSPQDDKEEERRSQHQGLVCRTQGGDAQGRKPRPTPTNSMFHSAYARPL
jgi:hypothetical protein